VKRRDFVTLIGSSALLLAAGNGKLTAGRAAPEVAITIDDFAWNHALLMTPRERNRALLKAFRTRSNLKAAIFVTVRHIDNNEGKELLSDWDRAGHLIGNHSYSHKYFNNPKVSVEEYVEDILKGESVLKEYSNFEKLFRFPYLKEGDTATRRDRIREFLKKNGYRNGHVTIDASDWAIEARLRERLTKNPTADPKPYGEFYLDHMWERANYYDDLAMKVMGRSVRHTMLMHYNLLNALFIGDLMDMFERKGWRLIDASEAFKDPVFSMAPQTVPAGESLIWALAKETGKFEKFLRYPAEDGKFEAAKMDKLGL
jgi:peptidoglycan/xylan/chitin deacetylase (PgdA/CDA1 family)